MFLVLLKSEKSRFFGKPLGHIGKLPPSHIPVSHLIEAPLGPSTVDNPEKLPHPVKSRFFGKQLKLKGK